MKFLKNIGGRSEKTSDSLLNKPVSDKDIEEITNFWSNQKNTNN